MPEGTGDESWGREGELQEFSYVSFGGDVRMFFYSVGERGLFVKTVLAVLVHLSFKGWGLRPLEAVSFLSRVSRIVYLYEDKIPGIEVMVRGESCRDNCRNFYPI